MKFRPWTQTEDDFVRKHFERLSNGQLAERMHERTAEAVKKRLQTLDLRRANRAPGPGRWQSEEEAFLRQNIEAMHPTSIAQKLGRSDASVRHKMAELKIANPHRLPRPEQLPTEHEGKAIDRVQESWAFIEALLEHHGDRAGVNRSSAVENVYRAPSRVTPFSYCGSPAAMCEGIA